MLASPGSIALKIGLLQIHWYGIIIAAAFLTGLLVTISIAKKDYPNPKEVIDNIFDLSTYGLIGAITGARIYYVLFNHGFYATYPEEIFKIWHGGISIHGAIIGGFISTYIYCKIKKISVLEYADLLSFGLILGQAIGRWGNFFNSEAFGLPTNLPWKLYIPPASRPEQFASFEYFHPTFLYESLWNILVFLILFFVVKKSRFKNKGIIFFSYLILYSTGRLLIESIRIDSISNILGIPIAQWMSILMALIGVLGLVYIKNKNSKASS